MLPPSRSFDAGRRTAALFAAAKLAIHLTCLHGYGWFRDELYYVACSQHPAWGYVDHPPFSVALLGVWRAVVGPSLEAMRIVPALAGTAVVFLTGELARRLGAGVPGIALACAGALVAPAGFAFHHYYSMNALDHLAWVTAALLALAALERPTRRAWLTLGLVLGLGVLNKWSVLWLTAGLGVALLATPHRRLLATPGPWLAAGVLVVVAMPHFVWQARAGFPTLEFMRNAMQVKYASLTRAAFLRDLVNNAHTLAAPVWIAGIVVPFVSRRLPAARVLAIVVVTTLAILLASAHAKAEYALAATYLAFAAGGASLESLARAWRPRSAAVGAGVWAFVVVATGAAIAPMGLPVLSETTFVGYQRALGVEPGSTEGKELALLPQFYADMHGWEALVAATKQAAATVTPEEGTPVIFAATGGYGPAAAIDVLGAAEGLPPAFSGHNSYWLWGPPTDAEHRPVIVLGGRREAIEPHFASLVHVGTVECGYCMPYENHKPVYVGRGLTSRWTDLWPALKHYD